MAKKKTTHEVTNKQIGRVERLSARLTLREIVAVTGVHFSMVRRIIERMKAREAGKNP